MKENLDGGSFESEGENEPYQILLQIFSVTATRLEKAPEGLDEYVKMVIENLES